MRTLPRPSALLLALVLAVAARPAFAQEWIRIDRCDSLVIAGHTVEHYQFSIHNPSLSAIWLASFVPAPYAGPNDTCSAIALATPVGWVQYSGALGGWGWKVSGGETPRVIAPGETLGGFEATLSRPTCRYQVGFGTLSEAIGATTFDFACAEQPTPSARGSWGGLKALYR